MIMNSLHASILVLILCRLASTQAKSDIWAVKIHGGDKLAKQLSTGYGYEYLNKLEGFDDIYILKKQNTVSQSKREIKQATDQLLTNSSVIWAENQESKARVKRAIIPPREIDDVLEELSQSDNQSAFLKFVRNFPKTIRTKLVVSIALKKKEMKIRFNDDLWNHQWYLHESPLAKTDHGITKVWDMGFTGQGVVVVILDDGVEWSHPDLRANYDHNASYDMNDEDADPSPRYDSSNSNGHGTRCAGEVAMAPHNKVCGVGVAFNAKIGGIRCLDGDISDLIEARSLSFKNNYIHIYSSSWGPNDDGKTVEGPRMLATEAIERGIQYGRNGKGSLYVWASGNGGSKGDNCNCDGYVSSIYTISIGSVSQSGKFPWYGERCASTLAVAYSSGAYNDKKVATTDIRGSCTIDHSGTSAAAPIAAGIFALVIEANPNLTWRDMQHLIVCTSEFNALVDNKGWKRNGAGFMFNSRFGYGLLMADSLVRAALEWQTMPEKVVCVFKPETALPSRIGDGAAIKTTFQEITPTNCPIRFLEHVQVQITADSSRRGNLRIFMLSPQNTASVLMYPRFKDNSLQGFLDWNLTSVQFWGENPAGKWRFYMQNSKKDGSVGTLEKATLIVHGITKPGGCLAHQPHRRYLGEELISSIIDTKPEFLESDANTAGFGSWLGNTFGSIFEDVI